MRSMKVDNTGCEDRWIPLLLRGVGELFGSSSIYPSPSLGEDCLLRLSTQPQEEAPGAVGEGGDMLNQPVQGTQAWRPTGWQMWSDRLPTTVTF